MAKKTVKAARKAPAKRAVKKVEKTADEVRRENQRIKSQRRFQGTPV